MQGAKKLNVSSTGILYGPRQNDWAKIHRIVAQSFWPPVKNTKVLQCVAAFWAVDRVREYWPNLLRALGDHSADWIEAQG